MPRLATVVLGAALVGCAPPCDRACSKLSDCDLNESVSWSSCVTQCQRERDRYADDEDDELTTAFDVQRDCIIGASCGELEQGVCYDERLFPFPYDPPR